MAGNNKGNDGQNGTERRRVVRRHSKDRRDLVRWEPSKSERRKGYGRRTSDSPKIR